MTPEILLKLDATRAFEARSRFHELTFGYVPFDDLVGGTGAEATLNRALLMHTTVMPVIGPSGAGKSALISWCVEKLGDGIVALRVPVASLGGDVARFPDFGQHVLRWTVKVAGDLTRAERRRLENASADSTTALGARHNAGMKVSLGLPARALGLELAGDLTRAELDAQNYRNAADVVHGLQQLVEIFTAREKRLVLLIDDTDGWLARPGDRGPADVADRFFADVVGPLNREVAIGVVIATHPEYARLPGYLAIRDRLAEVTVPRIPHPRPALEQVLEARIRATVGDVVARDVLTDDALTYLVAEYDNHERSLRHVLTVCDAALERVAPDYPAQLGYEHIRGAAVSLGA